MTLCLIFHLFKYLAVTIRSIIKDSMQEKKIGNYSETL